MKLPFRGVCALSCALVFAGCGADAKDSGEPAAGAGAGGGGDAADVDVLSGAAGQPAVPDACHDGCIETLAADCSHGPADQASCESACNALAAGDCAAEYSKFQACADGQALTCSDEGLPIVVSCSDEQAAFVACLNG